MCHQHTVKSEGCVYCLRENIPDGGGDRGPLYEGAHDSIKDDSRDPGTPPPEKVSLRLTTLRLL